MTNEQKEQILAYKRDGFGYKKIGKLMGLSENTIKSFYKRNKLEENQIDVQNGICPCCGEPIQVSTGRKQRKFCSDKCRMKWWNEHLDRVDKKANYEFVCAYCKKPFTAYGNAHRKYCCHECYIEDRFGGSGNV